MLFQVKREKRRYEKITKAVNFNHKLLARSSKKSKNSNKKEKKTKKQCNMYK